ncbi:MAG: hypothetical protein DHS20C15_13910 [Planctomycetota bacterium]|nr:MAG: hypothetical protein DHS20C15_13910 [Planctomycetota bacterium]
MRRTLLHFTLVVSLFSALNTELLANDSKPASGTEFSLLAAQIQVIQILGFAGCKFEIEATSSDEKVAMVSFNEGQAKKHKVQVEAMGVGSATITVSTKNGTNPGCQGFEFTFPVSVSADEKAFVKAGKMKLKDAGKEMKAALDDTVGEYCEGINALLKLVKAGEVSITDAIVLLSDVTALAAGDINRQVADLLDETEVALWNCPQAEGLDTFTDNILSFLPGGCGEWDKFESGAVSQAEKAIKKVRAKLKKAIKQLNKAAKQIEATVLILHQIFFGLPTTITPVPLPANPAQTPAPAIPKPLRKTSVASGRLSSTPVTRLDITGIGAMGGGQVTVDIVGPDGSSGQMMVDLEDDCTFRASFTGIKPGQYTVTLTQNGVTTTFKVNAA